MARKLYEKIVEAIEVLNEIKESLEEFEELKSKTSLNEIKMRDIIPREVCNKSVKMRAYNVLNCKGYLDISVLAFISRVSPEDVKGLRNAGKKSVEYIKNQLSTLSVDWKLIVLGKLFSIEKRRMCVFHGVLASVRENRGYFKK